MRAHLQAVRALLDLSAAGACRLRTCDRRHGFHHGATAQVLLLEQQVEPKVRLQALRHAARAHMRRWARPEPWDGLRTKARPHSRVRTLRCCGHRQRGRPRGGAGRRGRGSRSAAEKNSAASVRRAGSVSMGSAFRPAIGNERSPLSFPVSSPRKTRHQRRHGDLTPRFLSLLTFLSESRRRAPGGHTSSSN